jgi:RNA polymerase sigma-70 factor (ECF subfamily)
MAKEDFPNDALEDELLAVRCQLGERAAFDELIRKWAKPLRNYALRMTGDQDAADDATQEIWISVLRGIARLRDCSKLRPWLFGIAHRSLMDRLRSAYAMPVDQHADLSAIATDALDGDHEDARRDVERGLASLPIAERDVLTLFYLQELSLADVAGVLAVPVGTVKSRLFRARALLRNQLTDKETTP